MLKKLIKKLSRYRKKQNEKKIAKANLYSAVITGVDSSALTSIYSCLLHTTFHSLLSVAGGFFLFPLKAISSWVQAICLWRINYLEGFKKKHSITAAIIESLAAIAMTVGVIGGFAAVTAFSLATPIIFAVAAAGKTIYNIATAIHYFREYLRERKAKTTDGKKEQYRNLAIANTVAAGVTLITTVAAVFVFIYGKEVAAILGVVVSAVGVGYAVYKGVKSYQALKSERKIERLAQASSEEMLIKQPNDLKKELSLTHSLINIKLKSTQKFKAHLGTKETLVHKPKISNQNKYSERPIKFIFITNQELEGESEKLLSRLRTRH